MLYCAVYGVCHRQNTYGLKVVFCFRHCTSFHYHLCARLLTGTDYIVCLRCLLHHILSLIAYTIPGNPGICFHYYWAVYYEFKYLDAFLLVDRTRLFVNTPSYYQHYANLSEGDYKMPVRYVFSIVWVRLSIFSPFSIIQYVGLYVFSLPISLVMIEIIYILCLIIIIIKSEVWTIILV